MNARRLADFVESLRRNRRPKPFTPDADDVDAMRAAIELNNAQPGAALPRAEFVNDLHRRLADQLDETEATVDLTATRLSRRLQVVLAAHLILHVGASQRGCQAGGGTAVGFRPAAERQEQHGIVARGRVIQKFFVAPEEVRLRPNP